MADQQFPWEAFMQAVQARNQNRQAGPQLIGQGLATAGQAAGQFLQRRAEKLKKQQWTQAVNQALNPQPQQGPQPMGVGSGQGMQPPTSGFGAPQPDFMQRIAPLIAQDPSLAGQLLPGLEKQKPQLEWSPVSGMISNSGQPIEIDKTTGQMKTVDIPGGVKSTGYGSQMGPIRKAQYTLQDLPSNQGPNTAGGAAYQVKVASRQGKAIIAKAGSAQRTALAVGDLARAVLRKAPTDEAMENANFSNNLKTQWSMLKQKITADPGVLNNPQVRKEIYSIFDEMDKAATPFIQNQLDDMEAVGFDIPASVRKRQLGETLPDIPYVEFPQAPALAAPKGGSGGWAIEPVK